MDRSCKVPRWTVQGQRIMQLLLELSIVMLAVSLVADEFINRHKGAEND